nr:ankyrin-3-like [Penaeus vannamei]
MPVTSFRHNGVEKTEINDDHVNHQVKAANCKTSKNELSCKNTNTDKTVSPNSKLSQNGIEKKEHNGVHMDNKVESAGCKADRTTLPCLEKNTGKIVSSGSPLEQDVERRENNAVHDGRKASKNTLPRREEKTGPVMNNPFERTDNVDVTLTAESANGKQNGAPPVNPKKNGESVYSSHIQSVHNVIERTENRKSVLDIENMEDIHKAARQGDAEEVLKVLEKGEDPSAVTSANNTPLHYAAYEGHIEVAKLLMDKKSDPNLSNKSGNTSLHLAALNGKTEVAKLLCGWEGLDVNNPGATNETLLAYARYGEEKPMLVVLKNPDTISPEGNTPLHCASLAGQTEVVKLLLMNDADVKNKTYPPHCFALCCSQK